jgi:hypothetical protein
MEIIHNAPFHSEYWVYNDGPKPIKVTGLRRHLAEGEHDIVRVEKGGSIEIRPETEREHAAGWYIWLDGGDYCIVDERTAKKLPAQMHDRILRITNGGPGKAWVSALASPDMQPGTSIDVVVRAGEPVLIKFLKWKADHAYLWYESLA